MGQQKKEEHIALIQENDLGVLDKVPPEAGPEFPREDLVEHSAIARDNDMVKQKPT